MKIMKIGILGLGYVGIPLFNALRRHYDVIGYDLDKKKIQNLIQKKKFKGFITSNYLHLKDCNTYIVTVPTPVYQNNKPDLRLLKNACIKIAKLLNKQDLIIFESTFYPGLTEEYCVPIIEKYSKLKYKKDFHCGYSPERINPGDKIHTLEKITKITSGSDSKIANIVDKLYSKIIKAGTYKVSSIKIAEAAKIIENTQRDINIAFMNELEMIFDKMDINFKLVRQAAKTKWNFIDFYPGLVGGHCIGVDPYYLSYKSKLNNYDPKIILSGRKINNSMANYYAKKFCDELIKCKFKFKNLKVLILGFTFKKNVSDFRNTKVSDIVNFLLKKEMKIDIYDPLLKFNDVIKIYSYNFINRIKKNNYDAIILSVNHDIFKKYNLQELSKIGKKKTLFFDLNKNLLQQYFHIL